MSDTPSDTPERFRAGTEALRTGAVRSRRGAAVVRVRGEQAFDLLDAVSPRPLFLRDGQALHTVFLDDSGCPFADVYIACDDLDYLVFADGPDAAGLCAWLTEHSPAGLDAELVDLSATHTLIGLDGPYAWELLGRLVGPDVVGVPYLSLFYAPEVGGIGLRAGKTGEYGYDLLLPNTALPAFEVTFAAPFAEFGACDIGTDVLALAALENGFFDVNAPGLAGLGPAELQLQWRVDRRRTFPGRAAFDAARAAEPPRVTWFRAAEALTPGAPVTLDGQPLGRVLQCRRSVVLDAPIGQVLLDRAFAHPGLSLVADGVALRTVSAPLLHNRSLFLDAQRHAWATRARDEFPPIAPPWPS